MGHHSVCVCLCLAVRVVLINHNDSLLMSTQLEADLSLLASLYLRVDERCSLLEGRDKQRLYNQRSRPLVVSRENAALTHEA